MTKSDENADVLRMTSFFPLSSLLDGAVHRLLLLPRVCFNTATLNHTHRHTQGLEPVVHHLLVIRLVFLASEGWIL